MRATARVARLEFLGCQPNRNEKKAQERQQERERERGGETERGREMGVGG